MGTPYQAEMQHHVNPIMSRLGRTKMTLKRDMGLSKNQNGDVRYKRETS